ncbi:MAG TPA: hypothetical protein PK668_14920 [Myxococcota bacterium]|nr:hypothetical protein [Myxococcota bacterium]HRY94186.1 hypothetical protein [Myxococcota bacterium]HSA21748.1 hypothetical protein [Myxococcota bacterium]
MPAASGRIDRMLDGLAPDPFFSRDLGDGLGSIHVAFAFGRHGLRLEDCARLGRAEVEARLRSTLERSAPGLDPEERRARVARMLTAISAALCEQVELRLRTDGAGLMRRAARGLRVASRDSRAALAVLADVLATPAGSERLARLEALGLDRRAAEGLDLRMRNPGRDHLLAQIAARGAALPGRPPFTLDELTRALSSTAVALEGGARALERGLQRGPSVMVKFPALTRGLLAGLDPDSLVAQALRARRAHHDRCQGADEAMLALGGLLFDLGGLVAGGWLSWAGALYDLAVAGGQAAAGARRWDEQRLAHLAGGLAPGALAAERTARARGQGLSLSAGITSCLPGSTALLLGLERVTR